MAQIRPRFVLSLILCLGTVWVAGRLVLRGVGLDLGRTVGPSLVLYGAVYSCLALPQIWSGQRREAASMLWEGVGWAGAGAVLGFVLGVPRTAQLLLPLLLAAALLEDRPRWRTMMFRVLVNVLSLVLAIVLLAPLIWMLGTSLRHPDLPQPSRLEWWPEAVSLANYAELWELLPLARYLRNSLLVVALGIPLSLLVAAAAGFSLVHLPARWRSMVILLSLVGLAVPGMALWLTRFLIFRWLGVLNTPAVLLYPALLGGSPLVVLLLYRAFRRVPSDLWDQARIDGAGMVAMWWRIGLPQTAGVSLALSALIFALFWGNFIDPLLYLSDASWHTLPVGLQALQQLTRSDWPILMAASAVMTLPAIFVFAGAQRALLGVGTNLTR